MNLPEGIDYKQYWKLAETFAVEIAGYTKGYHGEFFNHEGNYVGRGDCLFTLIESFDNIAPFLLDWHDSSKPGPRGSVMIGISNSLSLKSKVWQIELVDMFTNKSYRRAGTNLAHICVVCLLDAHGFDIGIPK